jgi:hypothetical protein
VDFYRWWNIVGLKIYMIRVIAAAYKETAHLPHYRPLVIAGSLTVPI